MARSLPLLVLLTRGTARCGVLLAREMARFGPAALGVALMTSAPAAAYRVDPETQVVALDSLRDFEACQRDPGRVSAEACLDGLRAYVKEHPKEAFEAGKLARLHSMHWVALDFFVPALTDKRAKARCGDEDVAAAVVSALSLPPHYPAVAQAKEVVTGSCRSQLDGLLIGRLTGAGGAFRANACPLLAAGQGTEEAERKGDARGAARMRALLERECAPRAEAKPSAQPTQPQDLSGAAQQAAVLHARRAPPPRSETPQSSSVQRLEPAFRPVPVGERLAALPDATAELKTLDWRLLNLDNESAELLRGSHGEEVTMARTKPGGQEYVLLKWKGVRGPWNERVLVAVERRREQGKDYLALVDGRETVVMIERQRQYQAFPKGVLGGVWLNPVRPAGGQAVKLPARDLASEFASAAAAAK
jgi:hypothetical protein